MCQQNHGEPAKTTHYLRYFFLNQCLVLRYFFLNQCLVCRFKYLTGHPTTTCVFFAMFCVSVRFSFCAIMGGEVGGNIIVGHCGFCPHKTSAALVLHGINKPKKNGNRLGSFFRNGFTVCRCLESSQMGEECASSAALCALPPHPSHCVQRQLITHFDV